MAAEESSRFLQLPRELRDQIYKDIFETTRISYGEREDLRRCRRCLVNMTSGRHHIVPKPHSLALLSICHQLHHETREIWMKYVLFNFHDARSMLNKLSSMPHLIPKIRHLRLYGHPTLWYTSGFGVPAYQNNSVFDLLGGLRLDSLIVVSDYPDAHDDDAYETVMKLINFGSGWRELHYIVPAFKVLEFMMNGTYKPRRGNFSSYNSPFLVSLPTWTNGLVPKDYPESTTVETYWANEGVSVTSVIEPENRELYDRHPTSWDLQRFGDSEEDQIALTTRPLLIHVKRTDATQLPIEDSKAADMQQRFQSRMWKTRRYNLSTKWDTFDNMDDAIWPADELACITQVYDKYNDVYDV